MLTEQFSDTICTCWREHDDCSERVSHNIRLWRGHDCPRCLCCSMEEYSSVCSSDPSNNSCSTAASSVTDRGVNDANVSLSLHRVPRDGLMCMHCGLVLCFHHCLSHECEHRVLFFAIAAAHQHHDCHAALGYCVTCACWFTEEALLRDASLSVFPFLHRHCREIRHPPTHVRRREGIEATNCAAHSDTRGSQHVNAVLQCLLSCEELCVELSRSLLTKSEGSTKVTSALTTLSSLRFSDEPASTAVRAAAAVAFRELWNAMLSKRAEVEDASNNPHDFFLHLLSLIDAELGDKTIDSIFGTFLTSEHCTRTIMLVPTCTAPDCVVGEDRRRPTATEYRTKLVHSSLATDVLSFSSNLRITALGFITVCLVARDGLPDSGQSSLTIPASWMPHDLFGFSDRDVSLQPRHLFAVVGRQRAPSGDATFQSFTACVKDEDNGCWLEYTDTEVRRISVVPSERDSESFLLFYKAAASHHFVVH